MAIEADSATAPLSAGARVDGLNHCAAIRWRHFDSPEVMNAELARFIAELRDKRDRAVEQNIRTLSAIFYLAQIPGHRHDVSVSELTTAEKKALITAMNQLRAVVSLFPKRLPMPN